MNYLYPFQTSGFSLTFTKCFEADADTLDQIKHVFLGP